MTRRHWRGNWGLLSSTVETLPAPPRAVSVGIGRPALMRQATSRKGPGMATVTAYWHKGGGWWTVRVNDQRATVRGKAAAAAAAAVMRQAETDTDGGQGVAYLLRKRDGSRVDLEQAARGRFRWAGEYWQKCGDRWGWGPSETAHRFTATERAQAVADSSVPQVSAEWVTVYVEVPA